MCLLGLATQIGREIGGLLKQKKVSLVCCSYMLTMRDFDRGGYSAFLASSPSRSVFYFAFRSFPPPLSLSPLMKISKQHCNPIFNHFMCQKYKLLPPFQIICIV